jgi:hypothetical protein
MILPTFILGLLLVGCPAWRERLSDRRYRALQFGQTLNSTIMFKPNFQNLRDAFTVCSWVKKERTQGTPVWFSYYVKTTKTTPNEILISDDGDFNWIFDKPHDVRGNITSTEGQWTHYCMSWSISSRLQRIYYNGTLVGADATPVNRTLGPDGYLVLGNDQDCYGGCFQSSQIFGGQLYKLDVFSKELSMSEVRELWKSGLCSEMEERYGRIRYLKWEDILLESRNGNVTDVKTGCGPGDYSRWDVLTTQQFYGHVLTRTLLDKLITGWNILGIVRLFCQNP